MKLYFSRTSPFARKVRVVIAEKGITDIEWHEAFPWDRPAQLVAVNPLSQVPALVTDGGEVLYDSLVICEYLEQLGSGPRLLPDGSERWRVLRRHALANGLTEFVLHINHENLRRDPAVRSPAAISAWCESIARAADALESEVGQFGEPLTLAHIALGVALGYCDFRAGQFIDWRVGRPALAAWYARFEQRPSMRETQPP
jgi:glutathione S-transferase